MGREVAPSSTCHTSLSLRSCVFVASMVSFEILDFSCFFFCQVGSQHLCLFQTSPSSSSLQHIAKEARPKHNSRQCTLGLFLVT